MACIAGSAQAEAQNPATMAGVMTRWQTSTSQACKHTFDNDANETSCPRSLMFTITPDLDGMTLFQWVNTLALAGVNTGVIYVVPSNRLKAATISDQEWTEYNQYIYLPAATLSATQKQVILEVGEAISKDHYSVAQRNDAIVTFLTQLKSAFPNSTPVRFILDERTWFISHFDSDGNTVPLLVARVFMFEQIYCADIGGIIQSASQQGVDGWLSGVRLNEYASKDWNVMGPVMIDLVTRINALTSNWLTTHLFIGAGGGWGQDWKGIDAMTCPTTQGWQFTPCTGPFPFFKYLAPQVGSFAFGDKFMELDKPEQYLLNGQPTGWEYALISGEIIDFCKKNSFGYNCDHPEAPSVQDWQVFLWDNVDGLGLADLVDFLNTNAQAYPQLANVIFEGDNSDSLATITVGNSLNAALAISGLFDNAAQGRIVNVETGAETDGQNLGSWTGKIFLDAVDDLTTAPRPHFYGDLGYSMFGTNFNDFTFSDYNLRIIPRQDTTARWLGWP